MFYGGISVANGPLRGGGNTIEGAACAVCQWVPHQRVGRCRQAAARSVQRGSALALAGVHALQQQLGVVLAFVPGGDRMQA